MSSKSSLISISDLTNIQIDLQKVDSRRELKLFVTAFYEGQEWGVCQIIKEKDFKVQDFISFQARERALQQLTGKCLEDICIKIQHTVGPFRMALKKAIKLVDEGHYVPELTEK